MNKLNSTAGIGMQIKILSEVEKIWILYDLDNNGTLSFNELKVYLEEMSSGKEFNEDDLKKIFKQIDINNDGTITKDEMMIFI